jgi:hypothetical protein
VLTEVALAASALAELRHGRRNAGARPPETLDPARIGAYGSSAMRLYALVEADDSEAIDVYLREDDAWRALEDGTVCGMNRNGRVSFESTSSTFPKKLRPL